MNDKLMDEKGKEFTGKFSGDFASKVVALRHGKAEMRKAFLTTKIEGRTCPPTYRWL